MRNWSPRVGRSLAVAGGVAALALAGCSTGGASGGSGSDYPNGQLQYVVPYNPGGSTDPAGREFARLLADELGTTSAVENLPGGDETIGISSVIEAEPDGMSLGITSATGIIVQPLVNDALSYHEPSDFTSVVKMLEAPNVLVVGGDSSYQTLDDLFADAKDRPGEVRIGTTGRLTNNSFVIAALEEQAGIEVTIVPFSGGAGEAVMAAMSGEVEAAVPTAAAQLGLIDSGDLRALAHTGGAEYDDVVRAESFDEAGYDVPYSSDYLTVGPAGLPDDVQAKLSEAALKVAESDEWAEFCEKSGFVADPLQGDELDTWIADTIAASEHGIELIDAREE